MQRDGEKSCDGAAMIRKEFDLLKSQVRGQSVEIIQLRNKIERQGAQLNKASKQIETLFRQQTQQQSCTDAGRRKRSLLSEQRNGNRNKNRRNNLAKATEALLQSPSRQSTQVLTQFRSCHEISVAYDVYALQNLLGVSDTNNITAMFYIDPDGQGIGAPPIYVLCNLTNGITTK